MYGNTLPFEGAVGVRLPVKVLFVGVFVVAILALLLAGIFLAWQIASILAPDVAPGEREGSGNAGALVEEGARRSENVAFSSNWEGVPQLYVMDVSTGAWKRITSGSGNPTSPVFSPDGDKLAYSEGGDIYTIEASGYAEPRKAVSTPSLDYVPTWSPDGRKLAYTCKDGEGADICVVDAGGGGEPERITGPQTEDYDPTYSPDGRTIVYSGEHEVEGEPSGDLYAARPDGSEKRRITETVRGVRRFDAAFSPDGASIAYASDRDGDYDVYLTSPDGSGGINLTNDEQDNFSPSYSSDGEKIIYSEDAVTDVNLLVMGADGYDKQRITDSPAVERQPNWRPEPRAPEDRGDEDGLKASVEPAASR